MIKSLLNKKIGRENKKGFTLAELLIVVAIIGILVAISIPVFSSQLEKARFATDAANVRARYAELVVAQIDAENDTATVSASDLAAVCKHGSTVSGNYKDGFTIKSKSGKYETTIGKGTSGSGS